jgi:hypothetical protein
MTAIIVNGSTPFGGLANAAISDLITAIRDIHRVNLAQAAAQNGAPSPLGAALEAGTNFGVVPSSTAGAQGAAWSFALATLDNALQTFATANQASITALDNGN